MPGNTLTFPPFRLDPANACLWRGAKRLALPPKDFAVLHHLVTHAGQLVTHAELLQAVWGDTVVSPEVLKVRMGRLRRLLGDKAAAPRFIENVHGQGYRFIGEVVSSQYSVASSPPLPTQSSVLSPQSSVLVGRDTELARLHRWLAKAQGGERQLVFVTGEPGIGKTSLLEAFVAGVQDQGKSQNSKGKSQKAKVLEPRTPNSEPSQTSDPRPLTPVPWLARGQCIEHYGVGEGYLPILTALEQLCQKPGRERLLSLLRQHAPLWLAQLPSFLSAEEREQLQRETQGATRERMLREMATLLEVLTVEIPLVLVLEDLHWSDPSTLDLLAIVARRRDPARLLVIGTYRPTELPGNGAPLHSLVHELHAHTLCGELALRLLSEEDVTTYLRERFPRQVFPVGLARVLHRRTEGNPLFVVSAVDDLVAQGVMVQADENWVLQGSVESVGTRVPESIRHLVARQRERLQPEEQHVLEAASVAGMEFSVAAVAAALEIELVAVGERCARLGERRQFLRPAGIAEWPDGTVAARYGFVHALYQHLWSERVSIEQQQQWHLRVGMRKESAYGSRASEIAAELAVHFEQGRDYRRAIHYLQQAGENALRRSANREAVAHLTRGLELLQSLPDTPERTRQELGLRVALTAPLVATKGLAAAEVGDTHNRARELCQQMGEPPELFPVLWGLYAFYGARAELQTARALVEQLLRLAQRAQDPALLLQAHLARGALMFHRGEFVSARGHLDQAILCNPQHYRSQAFLYGLDPEVLYRSYTAWALWFLGYPDQALQSSREALMLAQELAHPPSLGFALNTVAFLHQYRREEHLTQEYAQEALTLATEHGLAQVLAAGTILRGWARAGQGEEGILQIHRALTTYRVIGSELMRPYNLALLAEAYGKVGQTEEGLNALAEALAQVDRAGERLYEAELWRLAGELSLRMGERERGRRGEEKIAHSPIHPFTHSSPEECFQKAIEVAKKQQAKSLELRAVMSLARLWQQQGKCHEAHQMLFDVYNWFTEGFDTKDLQEAEALLEELSSASQVVK